MTFWAKRGPRAARSLSSSELNSAKEHHFLDVQFPELIQLLFCLLVIKAFTFKLRAKASFLRLQNLYLALRISELVKRKRNTLAKHLRYRDVLKGVSSNFD
jgi:hypothetical protein